MRKEKGFTLIELLAVIVILGVIMMIAIPSVTGYITSSRKNSLITTAKQFVTTIRNQVTETNELPTATNETKTFGICGVELEKGGKTSPFGADWECDKSFVAIDYDGANYSYQVQLTDKDGNYLPLTDVDEIDGNLVTKEDISNVPGEEGAQKPTLASLVSVGDFVNYDAGNWTETRYGTSSATNYNPFNIPQQEFGGYTAGQSRNTSVTCYYASGTYYANQYNGWRVLNSNSETGEVTLISAGTPECYYHENGKSAESVENLKNHNWNQYVNNRYASAANVFTKTNLDTWYGSTVPYGITITNDLIKTGGFYWLAEAYSVYSMWGVDSSGGVYNLYNHSSYGVRVLVTLKSGIKTSGQDGSGVWQLV